ncbi:type III secretion system inner membrane ring subunit SctD [Achromobacter xylosoxidans]|uniref:type III secretion system inner membrane ring subunit SctD n=4 Tax=Alcaligenes xylosoxydans xylosoxydans TaxID=85698 RepID=UPI0012AA2547|nr:type III secretion system inner membrane ring subunit SctD [Achromobacter xylosoxidans]MDC6165088.1 type III secretion system inner membrane ring subunit SctD [Achromobacter xylosoxidans]CUR67699.1 type III secretion apparatus protein, YscD/HrpQ family [Achromobacter xylosoxidans]
MNVAGLELRVLSGLHRRASAPIGAEASIGADPDCDIVLADDGVAARAARIRSDETGWTLTPENGGVPERRQHGEPARLGPVWLTLAAADAPWTESPAREEAPTEDEPSPEPAGDLPDAAPSPAAEAACPPPLLPPRPARKGREALYVYAGMALMLLLCVSGVVYIIQPQPTVLAAADPMRQAIEESLPAIKRVLEQQGLTERLTISRRPDQSIIITGWLRDAAEQEQVATAMARIWPMPALRLSNEADLRATALNVLQAYPIRYDARYQGDGVVAIQGIAPDAEQRARVGDMLRAALPGVRLDLGAVLLADEVGQRLAAAAAQAGLPEPQAKWNGARLEIAPPDDPEQARRLASVIEDFNLAHFKVAALLPATSAAAPRRAIATTVPFTIRSVMGGAQPFVVLGDGTKLVPGGTYRQYRLVSIDNGKVTFDGPTYAVVSR